MKLTKDDVGKEFNTDFGIITMISHHEYESLFSTGDEGGVILLTNNGGVWGYAGDELDHFAITSRYDSRTWLKDMPDLGDIKDGWIACDGSGDWYWYDREPLFNDRNWCDEDHVDAHSIELRLYAMPFISEQWKQSKISIAELKQWQLDNKG